MENSTIEINLLIVNSAPERVLLECNIELTDISLIHVNESTLGAATKQ